MTTAIIALILTGIGLLGGGLVFFMKVVRHLTRIEDKLDQVHPVVAHVPNLYYRVNAIEKHLDLSTPEIPIFMNGGSK